MMQLKRAFAVAFFGFGLFACYAHARVESGPAEEHCRTVVVHNKHELETCHSRCNDEGCRTQCREHERVARERKCWVD